MKRFYISALVALMPFSPINVPNSWSTKYMSVLASYLGGEATGVAVCGVVWGWATALFIN